MVKKFLAVLMASYMVHAVVPVLDLDHMTKEQLDVILFNGYGTAELSGEKINKLVKLATEALGEMEKVFQLDPLMLEPSYHKFIVDNKEHRFHGYEDVRKRAPVYGIVRNQEAFYLKPYFMKRPLERDKHVNLEKTRKYYNKLKKLSESIYKKIKKIYHIQNPSTFLQENHVIAARRYVPQEGTGENQVGIPHHSNFNLFSIRFSLKEGFRVRNPEGEFELIPVDPNNPKLYINMGDWLAFQVGNGARPSVHGVPALSDEHLALSFFFNPSDDEVLPMPLGGEATQESVSFEQFFTNEKNTFTSPSFQEWYKTFMWKDESGVGRFQEKCKY